MQMTAKCFPPSLDAQPETWKAQLFGPHGQVRLMTRHSVKCEECWQAVRCLLFVTYTSIRPHVRRIGPGFEACTVQCVAETGLLVLFQSRALVFFRFAAAVWIHQIQRNRQQQVWKGALRESVFVIL